MSVVAPRYQDLFQVERRKARTGSSATIATDRVEHYRSLYEESQGSVAAAQAEMTSLQVQLDNAQLELTAKEHSITALKEQCNLLKSQVAEKEGKLQTFNQKLASIKAGVRKELEKQRSGAKGLQIALECVVRSSRELRSQSITPEEFHSSLDLILTTLTPHLATPTSSEKGAEFGKVKQQRLASLPLSERRQALAELATLTSSTVSQLAKEEEDVGKLTPSSPPLPLLRAPQSPADDSCNTERRERPGESMADIEQPKQTQMLSPYERMEPASVPRRHDNGVQGGVARRESRKKKMRYSSSDNVLLSKEEGMVSALGGTGEGYSGGQLHVWKKRLGLREGSVFTGSLPDLVRDEMGEGEGEEEEGGEDVYIDPTDLASVFISPRVSRKFSQRLLKRMDTMMNQTTPTYLKIIPPDGEGGVSLATEMERSATTLSYCCTTEDDLSSVDWDAGDEAERTPAPNLTPDHTHHEDHVTSPAPDHTHRVRRRRSNRAAAVVAQGDSDDERIYECIDELSLPSCALSSDSPHFHAPPRQLPLPRRRSKAASKKRRLRYSLMKGLDGYECLDLSPTGEGGAIPRWAELSPALPPPRKISAPPTNGERPIEHFPVQSTLSVPLEPSYASQSPAISSDDMNQSDSEATPELLYTTPSFVTMETRPHSAVVNGDGGEGGVKEHLPLQAKRSNTLPASSSSSVHMKEQQCVEHCGYLTKLDSRLRPGRRRWFVLTQQELRYYRSKEASLGRPRKVINLNSWCKLAIINDVIFKLMTSDQTFHLCGGTATESAKWVQALMAALRRPSEKPPHHVRTPSSSSPTLSGWAVVSESEGSKKMWCQLDSSGTLSLSLQPHSKPAKKVNLATCSVRKTRDSLLMDNKDSSTTLSCQLVIQREGEQLPIHIVPCNAEEKEAWFYRLSLASSSGRDEDLELTPTEQCLATIFKEGGALDHPLWKHPVLNVTDSPLRSSLTSLPSPSLTSKAFTLFQHVQMFMSTPLSRLSLEGHIAAAQHLISACLRHPPLCDELCCQLLRQLTSHEQELLTRPLQQGWCLLSLVLSMFLPRRPRVAQYLSAVLQRTLASSQPILSSFAQHCMGTLERVRETGQRKWQPSSQELEEILSRFAANPTSLKISMSLPVHLPDGTTKEVEFDTCSTVDELLTQLNAGLGLPSSSETGFALTSDWPGVEECAFFQLPVAGKMGDLLTCWWHAMDELSLSRGGTAGYRPRCIRLTYRNRLFLRSRRGQEVEREAELLAYQLTNEVASGRHCVPSTKEAIKMAAIMAQLEFGDLGKVGGGEGERAEEKKLAAAREALLKFGPMKLTQMTLEHDQSLYQQRLIESWTGYAGVSRAQCARDFLQLALQWELCGATLFLAEKGRGRSVWVAVHEKGVSLLSPSAMEPLTSYSWSQLAAFGSDGDHLVLVVTSSENGSHGNSETEKLLFYMSKAKIHQATNLMTSYLESRSKKR